MENPESDWCKKCGKCCKGQVVISLYEAEILVGEKVTNKGMGCPFLSKIGGCSVYEKRPIVCRAYGYKRKEGEFLSLALGSMEVVHFGYCINGPEVGITRRNQDEALLGVQRIFMEKSGPFILSSTSRINPLCEMKSFIGDNWKFEVAKNEQFLGRAERDRLIFQTMEPEHRKRIEEFQRTAMGRGGDS